jgi:hypothetical protein
VGVALLILDDTEKVPLTCRVLVGDVSPTPTLPVDRSVITCANEDAPFLRSKRIVASLVAAMIELILL